ncbi:type IX secretion system membrane protein PorP/SprF [Nibrella saemangeumensis]
MICKLYCSAFFLFVLLTGRAAFGQQDPQFSMYMFNPLYYNPAAAGSEGVTRFQLMHRTQWAGYQPTFDDGGSPSTQLFSFNMPLARIKSGVGLYVMNDRLGPMTNQALQVSYAYRMALKNGTLSLGVQGGVYSKAIDYGRLRPREGGDPLIQTGRIAETQPDLGAGVYYNTTDYWFGVSMMHINQAGYRLGTERGTNPQVRTAYLTGGYRLGIGYDLDVQPSLLVKTDLNTVSVEGSVIATYENRYWAGLSYRQQDALIATIGLSMLRNNALRFGYAFDFTVGGQDVKSPTSHEVLLSYSLPAPDPRRKPIIRTPRFRY